MAKNNIYRVTQSIGYGTSAVGSFSKLFSATTGDPNAIENLERVRISNIGKVPLELNCQIEGWENATPDAVTSSPTARYLRFLLPVGSYMYLPNIRCVDFNHGASSAGSAYVLDNKDPADINSAALYQVSGATLAAALDDSDTTITASSGHPFHVGDLIQVGTDLTTVTRQEMLRVTAIDGDTLSVDRALYGTSKADKDSQTDATEGAVSGARIHLPFFNTTQQSNRYGGLATCQTDTNGIFHIMNFFGYGRTANNIAGGVVPGSVSGKFYSPGYQEFGLKNISSASNTGLAVSTEYGFDITVDGSGLLNSDTMKFTTDSSNVNFGGTNGVLSKIQDVFDTQYYTAGNLFEERVTISLVGGDVRIQSGQALSTSAILLAAPSEGETTPFGVGRIPAIGNINSPTEARVPNDLILDRVSGIASKNDTAFFYDDGNGNIQGACGGSINYLTGELMLKSAPPSANFVFSGNYGSALSGGTDLTAAGGNSIGTMSIRSMNYKIDGTVEFIGYE